MNWYLKVLQNYANFEGRARRMEYWMFVLISSIISFVLGIIDGIAGTFIPMGDSALGILQMIYGLAVFIPGIAVIARRLHDIGKSGWMFFVVLIPCAGAIIFLLWMIRGGDRGANQYGSDPLGLGNGNRLREADYEDKSYEDDPEDRPRRGRGRLRDDE